VQILTSNFQPVKLPGKSFPSAFEDMIARSDLVRIATGYIAADALAEIEAIVKMNKSRGLKFDLILGMHKFSRFLRQRICRRLFYPEFLLPLCCIVVGFYVQLLL
jgi:hypothetical protein